jgi:hypothetical protein
MNQIFLGKKEIQNFFFKNGNIFFKNEEYKKGILKNLIRNIKKFAMNENLKKSYSSGALSTKIVSCRKSFDLE